MLSKRSVGSIAGVLVVAGAGYYFGHRADQKEPRRLTAKEASRATNDGACEWRVTKEELVRSVELGTKFLLAHQREPGNFDYLYDWKTKTYSNEDNDVRQAGALWALALLQGYAGPPAAPPELRPALEKGLAFFDKTAAEPSSGVRFPVYVVPGAKENQGSTGTAALVALSMLDYVRGLPPGSPQRETWTAKAKAYVKFLAQTRTESGLWFSKFHYDGGAGFGRHSPYSDGESLLALVIAMKYLGQDDLAPVVKAAAEAGHKVNVDEALAKDEDSDETKGFYQWSSMAFYELATSPMGKDGPYGDWLVSLADWMLDVHHVLEKGRNTAYAYEGIVSAYAWAKATGDSARAAKYECAIHHGLSVLMSWQVGHPRATELGPSDDPKAIGGIQNHKTEPGLRIDVTQHQMHATMMAIQHLFQ
jgi:UDP-N-acetylmuramoyl-tripeptide--D-alanyl-D-alanine ligase